MAKAKAKQTGNKVSMEDATSLGGYRKAMAARRTTEEMAALRETLKTQAEVKGPKNKVQMASELKKTATKHADPIPKTALRLVNPTYLGMDTIPEKLAKMQSMKPKQKRK
jgi:hypothetical protein